MSGAFAGFSTRLDGDVRGDQRARERFADRAGIPRNWATLEQLHGCDVVEVNKPGHAGSGDAMFTRQADVPLAIFTADCVGVAVLGEDGVGVAHAGWRGLAAGVVTALIDAMYGTGLAPTRVIAGPSIRSCCFEVGSDVATVFPGETSSTTWGTTSVDLISAVASQVRSLDFVDSGRCTSHEDGYFSHRRDGDLRRMATLVMLRRPAKAGSINDDPD